jgi:hypothetical protein
MRWIVDMEEDMQIMEIRRWRNQCKERAEWRRIYEKAETHSENQNELTTERTNGKRRQSKIHIEE